MVFQVGEIGLKKICVGILATILLGALGSGVWDMALKPLIYMMQDMVLTIGTLGVKSLIDSVYIEVGVGNTARSSNHLLSFLVAPMLIIGFLNLYYVAIMWKMTNNRTSEISRRVMVISNINKTIQRFRSGISDNFLLANCLVLQLCIIILVFSISKTVYASDAHAYLIQISEIASPFLSAEEKMLVRSRIYQIHSREDFSNLRGMILKVIDEKKLYNPPFDAF